MDKLRRLVGYGIGDFGLNIYWHTLSIWLVYWYTTIVGIRPEIAGTIFFAGMIWDAFSDPIVASLAERMRTRHGTYRPFLLYGSFILAACFVLLFWVPPLEGAALIAVLVFVVILFRTAYTIVAIPYAAMSVRLTYDSVERTEFSGVRMFFAFGGLLLVSNLLPPLTRYASGGPDYTAYGFQTVIILGGIVATIALLLCFAGTREKPPPMDNPNMRITFKQMRTAFASNRVLVMLLAVIFMQSAANAALMGSMAFLIDANQDTLAAKETVMTAFAVATMAGVPLWTMLVRPLGKKVTWVIASAGFSLLGLHMLMFGPVLIGGVPVQLVGFGLCLGAFAVLMWSFIPDAVEYGQMQAGYRTEGVVFGSVLIVQKLSGGFMIFIFGLILGAIGYDGAQAAQSEAAARGLIAFMAICPSVLLFLSMIPILRLPLNRHSHADIVDKLSQNREETR